MSTTKTTIVAAVVLVVTFVTGVVAGIGLARFAHLSRGPRGPIPQFATHMMLSRLDKHLDLNDAQEAQIRTIFERRHKQMVEEIATTNTEIERVLTPEQREKFKRMRMHLAGRRGR